MSSFTSAGQRASGPIVQPVPFRTHKRDRTRTTGAGPPKGKAGPQAPGGKPWRHGINDYTGWFAGNAEMAGQYFGYDGPFPPFNDARVHRYLFLLYALDVDRCPVDGAFTGPQVLDAIRGHVLAQACYSGRYTLNPRLLEVEKA